VSCLEQAQYRVAEKQELARYACASGVQFTTPGRGGNECLHIKEKPMAQAQSRKVTVINPVPDFAVAGVTDEVLSASVPLDALKENIRELIDECREMFRDASTSSEGAQIAHVDVAMAISVDGSVGIVGASGLGEAGGGFTVRLTFGNASQTESAVH
jgi:hypothetical protein